MSDHTEEWRSIAEYAGLYEVSDTGRIRSLDRTVVKRNRWGEFPFTYRSKILAPDTSSGLPRINLRKDGTTKHFYIHLLRAEAFNLLVPAPPTPEERFWENVDKTDDCWIWTAGAQSAGYGMIFVDGRKVLAHRFSYELAHGPITDGLYVDHACHNPRCVNPEHLRTSTPKQNMENRKGAQRNSLSGIRGVRWVESRGKWNAQIGHKGKVMNLGYFATSAAAEAAASKKRNELFTHHPLGPVPPR